MNNPTFTVQNYKKNDKKEVDRMSAVMAQETNRLINEKSPYLLQHAHNPVAWYPWREEAFKNNIWGRTLNYCQFSRQ